MGGFRPKREGWNLCMLHFTVAKERTLPDNISTSFGPHQRRTFHPHALRAQSIMRICVQNGVREVALPPFLVRFLR